MGFALVCPKPSRAIPIPRRSISLGLRSWLLLVAPKVPLFGLIGVGDAIFVAEALAFSSASARSASGS